MNDIDGLFTDRHERDAFGHVMSFRSPFAVTIAIIYVLSAIRLFFYVLIPVNAIAFVSMALFIGLILWRAAVLFQTPHAHETTVSKYLGDRWISDHIGASHFIELVISLSILFLSFLLS